MAGVAGGAGTWTARGGPAAGWRGWLRRNCCKAARSSVRGHTREQTPVTPSRIPKLKPRIKPPLKRILGARVEARHQSDRRGRARRGRRGWRPRARRSPRLIRPPDSGSNNSDATDAALDELIIAAREVLRTWCSRATFSLVDQAARDYERDPDPALSGQADVDRPADVESEPAGDFAGWVRQVNAAVADAERAAARGRAGRGRFRQSGSRARASTPRDACPRRSTASRTSTFGARRPGFIPVEGGSQAWQELRERLDEARQRASAACSSIEPPR